jgi:hypothetical protein
MNTLHDPLQEASGTLTQIRPQKRRHLPEMIHVLAVGRLDRSCPSRDVLFDETRIWPSIAVDYIDYRELWTRSGEEIIHVFVLCEALARLELEEATRFIRQQWPRTRILVIVDGEDFLDDPLYDDRILPRDPPHVLVTAIERLLGREAE